MDDSATSGILGAIIVVTIICVVFLIATKKSPWNLSNPIPDEWKKGKLLLITAGVVLLFLVVWFLPSQSPSPKKVWEFFKNYWLWMILILAILFFASSALHEDWVKGARGMVIVVAVVLVGAMAVHGIWGESSSSQQVTRSEIPLASSPQSTWPKLVIPAGIGKESEHVSIPPYMHMVVKGDKFRLHQVNRDGSKCTVGTMPCSDNAIASAYVTNEDPKNSNTVIYAFAPQ